MLDHIIDIIYPMRCPVCEDIPRPKESMICTSCVGKLTYIIEPKCKKCGKSIEYDEVEYCSDCTRKKYSYIHGCALWEYDEVIRNSIARFKNKHKKEYGRFYIHEIVKHYGREIKRLDIDALVPVPIHKSKLRERGYNQAEILAKGMGKELDILVLSDLILRNKRTLPQKQLSYKERLSNLQKAFFINELKLSNIDRPLRKVMLVDDIYTTGSTIEACTKTLINGGVEKVYFLTLSIGKGF